MFHRHHVDDILTLLCSPDHVDKFKEYLFSEHPIIYFSVEKEKDGCLPSLDIDVFRENKKLANSVYRKISLQWCPTSKVLYLKHKKLV